LAWIALGQRYSEVRPPGGLIVIAPGFQPGKKHKCYGGSLIVGFENQIALRQALALLQRLLDLSNNPKRMGHDYVCVGLNDCAPVFRGTGSHLSQNCIYKTAGALKPLRFSQAHTLVDDRVIQDPHVESLIHAQSQNIEGVIIDCVDGPIGGAFNNGV
jgi:hypothetical protein